MDVYFLWRIENIEADHDGYCSGADNDENIYENKIYCKYNIGLKEYHILKWLNYDELFTSETFIALTKPFIDNEQLATGAKSVFCEESEHGLRHEIQKTPLNIIKLIYKPKSKYEIIEAPSYSLVSYLNHTNNPNIHIIFCLKDFLPFDIINVILMSFKKTSLQQIF